MGFSNNYSGKMNKSKGLQNWFSSDAVDHLLRSRPAKVLGYFPFLLSFAAFVAIIFDYGFDQNADVQMDLHFSYILLFLLESLFLIIRYSFRKTRPHAKVWIFDSLLFVFMNLTNAAYSGLLGISFFVTPYWLVFMFLMIFLRELSNIRIEFKRSFINPAQLFMISFMGVIMLGTVFLMFPNATVKGISFIDALFTSASAVCVTGLSVVDTGTYFTPFGQITIMILIQLGGLGIMTFTSYFSYFFTGESSYENQLLIQEMTNSDKITEVFGTLKKVILLTFIIEFIGAILIFISLESSVIPAFSDRIFFSVFHVVSSFCNAGFSTLEFNFYDIDFRFNYSLHVIVAFLIIIGGMGFPILFNLYKYLKHFFTDWLLKKENIHIPWIININSRIVGITTFILIVLGTSLFYIFEQNNTLAEHSGFGKVITAFFGAVTPRTAGFNTIDNASLALPTLLLVYFLMWVGASPASTGGGIKTSTLAISVLNSISIARGKDRIEFFGREISDTTVRRAYSQIFLSLFAIGLSVFVVAWYEKDIDLKAIIFECISAFSTVGLSLGITAKLCTASKAVIVITMFVGRISMLTLLGAIFKQVKYLKYRYPSEDILIN